MSEKYKTTFRGYLKSTTISPDPPAVTLEKLNPEEFERFFLEADLNEMHDLLQRSLGKQLL